MIRRVGVALLGAALLLAPARGAARGTPPSDPEPARARRVFTAKIKLDVPFATLGLVEADQPLPVGLGGSLALELWELLALEAGGQLHLVIPNSSHSIYTRAGVPWPLWQSGGKTPLDRAGSWQLQLPTLVGYRYLDRTEGGDGYSGHEVSHCLTLDAGLEAGYWFLDHLGLHFRLLLGVWIPLSQSYDDTWTRYARGISPGDEMDWALDLGFSFGLSF